MPKCPICNDLPVHMYIHNRIKHPKRFHKMMERKAKEKLDYVENCRCPKCIKLTKKILGET